MFTKKTQPVKEIVRRALWRLGYRLECVRETPLYLAERQHARRLQFDDVVCRRIVESQLPLSFVQIGAYDGVLADPLRKYIDRFAWTGVMLEPQASAVDCLRALYANNPRIVIVNAAIDRAVGKRTLHTIKGESVPEWARGLASFQPGTIIKHHKYIPEIASMMHAEQVNCVTFTEVLNLLPRNDLDVLQIDTEGADAEILNMFPLDSIQPKIIHWEIKHLSKIRLDECMERLAKYKYKFALSGGEDMVAIRDGF